MSTSDAADALAELESLHDEVDVAAESLSAGYAERLLCAVGCAACCVDELTVFTVEAARIRLRHAELLGSSVPHPVGACAFLDHDLSCRIYASRPYVCRTQGLPLRWLDEGPDGQLAEFRDVCELNDGALDLTALEPADCWTLGPVEAKLRELQQRYAAGDLERIALRGLFERR